MTTEERKKFEELSGIANEQNTADPTSEHIWRVSRMFKKRIPPKEVSEEDSAIKHPIKTNEIKQGALKKLRILFTNVS